MSAHSDEDSDTDADITFRKVEGGVTTNDIRPQARRYHAAAIHGTTLFVYGGGVGSSRAIADLWAFDINTLSWAKLAQQESPPTARFGHSLTTYKDSIYLFGGILDGGSVASDELYRLDPTTHSWVKIGKAEESAAWPSARGHHQAQIYNDSLYVIGGETALTQSFFNDVHVFNFATGTWSVLETKNPPPGRGGFASFIIRDTLYVFGGHNGEGGLDFLDDLYALPLDEETFKWTKITAEGPAPETARSVACVTYLNQGFVFGGWNGRLKAPESTLIRFDPRDIHWHVCQVWMELGESLSTASVGSKSTLPTARYACSGAVDAKGRLVIFGGSGSTYLNDVIVFKIPKGIDV